MNDTIYFRIKTLSNLFIGGAPIPFEIGGIDQQTAMDPYGFPCIPGSSLKGTLRAIVHEDDCDMANEIRQMYRCYLEKGKEDNWGFIQEKHKDDPEAVKRIAKKYEDALKKVSAEYLFGIEAFNNTPKLLFGDLILCDEFRDAKSCFSIDMKNSIDLGGKTPSSNPRTYKTARTGLIFEGQIGLHKIETLGENAREICEKYIIYNLMKFNSGFCRLGNSKSRGYGKVEVIIPDKKR